MSAPRKTLFVDVSEIAVMGGQSGIQRVVRRIVQQATDHPLDYHLEPVVSVAGRLHLLNARGYRALRTGEVGSARASYDPQTETAKPRFLTVVAKAAIKRFPWLYDRIRNRSMEHGVRVLAAPNPIRLGTNDIYVLLDSFWVQSSAPSTAVKLRRRGHKVVAVVYDVLIISHPDYVPPGMVVSFRKALHRMADGKVPFVSISKSAAKAVVQAIPKLGAAGVGHFYLGHDLPDLTNEANTRWPSELWTGNPVFMTVGTFEIRKNHAVVLAAFETLWRNGSDLKLLMIGQRANGVGELLERLAGHPELGRKLFVFHESADAELADAYRRATSLILPSFIEGFGLPLVEGLGLGLPVIASDIDVFREIGGDACRFFDCRSSNALVEAIYDVAANPETWRARAKGFVWPDWQEATEQFVLAVSTAAEGQENTLSNKLSPLTKKPTEG